MNDNILINEASDLSTYEKMKRFDRWLKAGRPRPYDTNTMRAENIAATERSGNTSKLNDFRNACLSGNFDSALDEVEKCLVRLGVLQKTTKQLNAEKARQAEITAAASSVKLTADDFPFATVAKIVKNDGSVGLHATYIVDSTGNPIATTAHDACVFLIVAIIFGYSALRDVLIKTLTQKCGMSTDTIKSIISNVSENGDIVNKLDRYREQLLGESLEEDTKKVKDHKWVNKGKDGTHGTFTTKKAADAQRKAMFANGFHEDIEKHDILNPKLWNEDNTLKEEVIEKINDIVNEFIKNLEEDGINLQLDDVILIGSNCSYNYNKDSDLDIHLIANTKESECPQEYLDKLYSAYRSIFNKNINIDFYGIPVEIYVETENSNRISNGVYSVLKNEWIKEPVKEEIPEIDKEALDKSVKEWEDRYNKIVNSSEEKFY